jgi:hypothetical protein
VPRLAVALCLACALAPAAARSELSPDALWARMTDAERRAALNEAAGKADDAAGIGPSVPFGDGADLSAADGEYPRALRDACEALTGGGGVTTDDVPLEITVNGRRVAGCDCRPREVGAQTGTAAASSCFR